MTRIGFTADLHCDDFGSALDPATGLNARWVDTLAMARWVATDARARKADVLVVGGDFTEGRRPAPWRVAQIGEALAAFGGPEILLRGNHDELKGGRSIADALASGRPGWHGFSKPGITIVDDVAIVALPYLDAMWLRAQPGFESVPEAAVLRVLAEQFVVIAGGLFVEASALAPRRVLTVHQGISGGLMSDTQRAFLGDKSLVVDGRALAAIGFDAVLAGHFHLHQVLQAEPLVVYAGAPYRTDFGEADQVKGYLIVDVDEAGVRMEFVETPARRYVTLDFADDPDLLDFEDRADGAIVRVLNAPPDLRATFRRDLERVAFAVTSLKQREIEDVAVIGSMSESLTAEELLEQDLADHPDREALLALGREILGAVA